MSQNIRFYVNHIILQIKMETERISLSFLAFKYSLRYKTVTYNAADWPANMHVTHWQVTHWWLKQQSMFS